MKIAIYARVSKERCNSCGKPREGCTCKEFQGQDTENQLRELREFAAESKYTITREYIDHESAKSGERDEFQMMLQDAGKRKFKAVLVWALDRFTREGIEATFAYVRTLKDGGCDFISYTEPHFRTTGPAGSLMLAVAAWIAEQERKRISDRTKAGLVTARAKGKRLGRPVKDVSHARVMELHSRLHERTGKPFGVARIAAELMAEGVLVSRETVRRILGREE